MEEVAAAGEHHRPADLVHGVDRLVVPHRSAGLDDRGDAGLQRQLGPVGEGEVGVGGQHRARRRRRAPSPAPGAPSRRGSSGPPRSRSSARSRAMTIALDLTCLQTRQANESCCHSASVGRRSVTTCISERSSRSKSRSWTSRPPITWRRWGSIMLGIRRSWSSRIRVLGFSASTRQRLVVVATGEQDLDELVGQRPGQLAVDPAVHARPPRRRPTSGSHAKASVVGLERGRADGHAARVVVLDDHARRDLELAQQQPARRRGRAGC